MRGRQGRAILLTACWLLVVSATLWGILRMTGGNLAAFLGALAIWWAAAIGVLCYETVVARRPLVAEDRSDSQERAWARVQELRWPGIAASSVLPGLWIGAVARSPLLVAAGFLLGVQAIGWLNEHVPSRLPADPLTHRPYYQALLWAAAPLLAGMMLGAGLRILCRW